MNKKISTVAILIICIVLAGGATVGVLHKDGIISSDSIFAPKPSENNRPSGNSAVASGSSLSSNRKITREALLKNGQAHLWVRKCGFIRQYDWQLFLCSHTPVGNG
jgi:hypothetical protein